MGKEHTMIAMLVLVAALAVSAVAGQMPAVVAEEPAAVNATTEAPSQPEAAAPTDAELAVKADHDRRVKLSRVATQLRRAEPTMKSAERVLAQAQQELDWAQTNPTYTETVKTHRKCNRCQGKGTINDLPISIRSPLGGVINKVGSGPCPVCGGDGRKTTSRPVTRTRDLGPYQQRLAQATALHQKAKAECDKLKAEEAALRNP